MNARSFRHVPAGLRRLVLLTLLVVAASAPAGTLVEPDPALPAREVVEIQLQALQALGTGGGREQILQVWAMAHPANKAYVGTLSRFGAMLRGPGYDGLVGHAEHRVLAARASDDVAEFYVTVQSGEGATSAFVWVLQKVADGEHAGCWMTVAVSPAVRINRSA